MALPKQVLDALDGMMVNIYDPHCIMSSRIVTIRAHLLNQETELKILRLKCAGTLANNLCPDHRDKQVGKPCLACVIENAESRLAAANALLREAIEWNWLDGWNDEMGELDTRIQTHLQGAGDEA